jgi:hypothetical protein
MPTPEELRAEAKVWRTVAGSIRRAGRMPWRRGLCLEMEKRGADNVPPSPALACQRRLRDALYGTDRREDLPFNPAYLWEPGTSAAERAMVCDWFALECDEEARGDVVEVRLLATDSVIECEVLDRDLEDVDFPRNILVLSAEGEIGEAFPLVGRGHYMLTSAMPDVFAVERRFHAAAQHAGGAR